MTAEPILIVAGAAHAYGGKPVLRGVDLTLRPGDGQNGRGHHAAALRPAKRPPT